MDTPLRDRLADRAFLFDHPSSYLAGVDAAIHAITEQRQESPGSEAPLAADVPQPVPDQTDTRPSAALHAPVRAGQD